MAKLAQEMEDERSTSDYGHFSLFFRWKRDDSDSKLRRRNDRGF